MQLNGLRALTHASGPNISLLQVRSICIATPRSEATRGAELGVLRGKAVSRVWWGIYFGAPSRSSKRHLRIDTDVLTCFGGTKFGYRRGTTQRRYAFGGPRRSTYPTQVMLFLFPRRENAWAGMAVALRGRVIDPRPNGSVTTRHKAAQLRPKRARYFRKRSASFPDFRRAREAAQPAA